jgi:alkylation response protein AidB-like acyl-CoA dehydrogenase
MNDETNAANGRSAHSRTYPLSAELLALARTDPSGVPRAGRRAESDALREAGRLDASLGRIYEGHLNGAQLVARYGTAAQRARLEAELDARKLFGVWNTQDGEPVRIALAPGGFVLSGSKTWASGAGSIARAVITAANADGALQMCLVPMDRVRTSIDPSEWQPLGMEGSDSFRVSFDGVELDRDDLIGGPDDYARQPWFYGGALRFLAVHTGVIERLQAETVRYLLERGRERDPFQQIRAAQMRIAVATCRHWLSAGIGVWETFDADESAARAEAVIDTVDMARAVVERAALDASELAIRSVGARGLLEPLPFARLVRDLQMYLRQPAPDAALLRVADGAFREAANSRSAAIASSTGTIS